MSKRFRGLMVAALAVSGVLAMSQTALGYIETGHTGTVGVHSLTDTSGSPGATCEFNQTPPATVAKLNHLWVRPPHMKAVAGMGTEKVGWRIILQRQDWNGNTAGDWLSIKKSAISTAFTNATSEATFAAKGLKVTVPYAYGTDFSQYRVAARLIWYKANGKILGTATERVEWYVNSGGVNTGNFNSSCPDYDD